MRLYMGLFRMIGAAHEWPCKDFTQAERFAFMDEARIAFSFYITRYRPVLERWPQILPNRDNFDSQLFYERQVYADLVVAFAKSHHHAALGLHALRHIAKYRARCFKAGLRAHLPIKSL